MWQSGLNVRLDPNGANIDLTPNLIAIPLLTDVVTDEVRQAILVLSADGGKYITSSIINQFDKIRINHTDQDGNIFNEVFEVIKIIPRQTQREGTKLELHLIDNAHSLQDIQYIKPHYSETPKNVSIDICQYYNSERGSLQPTVTDYDGVANELPHWVINNYDFGLNEDSCFDRLKEVVDKNAASADAGGVLDFYETRFHTDESNQNLIRFSSFISGSKPVSPVTIDSSTSLNIGESEAGIEAQTGTVVINWGSNNDGTLPTDFSRFRSAKEAFDLQPGWVNDAPYKVGHKVNYLGSHYICTTDRGTGPNSSPLIDVGSWNPITEASEFGNVITYSLWTRQKTAEFKNSGSNYANAGNSTTEPFGRSMWDGNLVIWDDSSNSPALRTWVHVRSNTSANINTNFLYDNISSGQYRGLRILVDQNFAAIGVPWNQNGGLDINNKTFANSIVQHNGGNNTGSNEYKNWNVIYEAKSTAQNGMMCAVRDEGRVYVYDNTTKWVNKAATGFANDCFHPYISVTEDGGILSTSAGDTPFTANTASAVKIVYEHTGILPAPLTESEAGNANYYSAGVWINFAVPYPENTYNSIIEDVGDIYGGGIQGASGVKEPATIDSQNMHLTHDGLRGFNHGLSSADFGQLGSLDLFLKHLVELQKSIGGYDVQIRGDLKWRCYLIDTGDNVVFQDFTLPHNGVYEAVSLPLTGFQTYRGRKPFKTVWASLIPSKQLSPVSGFLWRNIKLICFQWQEPYDNDGRYSPWITSSNTSITATTGLVYNKARHTAWIDGLRFSKPLLVVTDAVSTRVIQQQGKESPTTINYNQLLNDAKAELEKQKFQRRQYDVVTSGKYNVKAGESFLLHNINTVPQSDGPTNTIKLVAKRIEYSITKPKDGSGGFIRTLQGVRRLET